jgi:hypothetical protein
MELTVGANRLTGIGASDKAAPSFETKSSVGATKKSWGL